MNKKTRDKIYKHFGEGNYFDKRTKIPFSDVMIASWVMGNMNSEKFWNSIIKNKIEREKGKNICEKQK